MKKFKDIDTNKFLLAITIVMFFLMYIAGMIIFNKQGFAKPQVFLNLFVNNAGLIVIATSMTMVMIIGGIDISVGSLVAMDCMILGDLMMNKNWGAWTAMLFVLLIGLVYGSVQGFLISYLGIQPFIITLAGMFFGRGMTAVISTQMISITNETFAAIAQKKITIPLFGTMNKHGKMMYPFIYPSVIIALVILVVMFVVLKYTKFGRSIYAIGGNEQSAMLMGLNVKKTKFCVYVLDGFLASIGGILFCMNTMAGFVEQAKGFEMDAIAGAVIGGTLLTGGVGNVFGSLFGCMIRGTIESFISFQGTLSSWWVRITIALLLTFFIVLQSIFQKIKAKN
ncbi:monosaccharide ABC transporter membrane protein, CUT2 family [Lachnospiraceae bacterium KH1T2]|nr:monosaccharide ABC transporter membrane protein, CUT2 family [Lachnospiraceae bacterium KH1T2]